MANSPQILRATYNSPSNPAFSHTAPILPLLSSNTTSGHVNFISSLRKEAAVLQNRINAELTKRMDDDKALQASDSTISTKNKAVDEIAEEENYGEEDLEED